jgi:CHAD domain-containing protein
MTLLAWRVPHGTDPHDLPRVVAEALEADVEASFAVERHLLDTFDGAFGGRGEALVIEEADAAVVARLVDSDGSTTASAPIDVVPRRAADLPAGRLREIVGARSRDRALLVRARARVESTSLVARDGLGTPVLSALVERVVAHGASGPVPVGTLVRLFPEPGHDDAAERARVTLDELALDPVEIPPAHLVLHALGLPVGSLMPPWSAPLDAGERTDRAVRQVLRTLRAAWRAVEPGTRDDLDTEFLHDWRVALRRTRAVLAGVGDVLPAVSVARFRDGFRWLQAVSGPSRDLDVALAALPALAAGLPSRVRDALGPLEAHLRRKRAAERAHLVAALGSPRHRRLARDWGGFVERESSRRGASPDARRPVAEVVGERVRAARKKLLRDGRAITDETPVTDLHELRKTAKKLRYLLDLFAPLWPDDALEDVLPPLKALQTELGLVQDLEVQAHGFATDAATMMAEGTADAPAILAVGVLVEDLRARQAEARSRFADVFDRFDRRSVRRALRAVERG